MVPMFPLKDLPTGRAAEILSHLKRIFQSASVPYSFIGNLRGDPLRYFAAEMGTEMGRLIPFPFVYVPHEGITRYEARILIGTAHGEDLSQVLWELRRAHPDAFVAIWLWDNHIAHVPNLRSSLAVDFLFPSHAYDCRYLTNPVSAVGPHVALCSAQWASSEAGQLFAEFGSRPRKNKLLVNYVDYKWAWRSELLRTLAAEAPEAEVLTMLPEARDRYFAKTAAERFREWADYKCTVMLPVDRDLSTRLFDALLAGLVPVVPRLIEDFDAVVPRALQEELGVVRIDGVDVAAIREGARNALERFDRMGIAGVQARHRYALENHLLVHRVYEMLIAMRSLGTGGGTVGVLPDGGLYTRSAG